MDIDFIFRLFGKAKIHYTNQILGNYLMVETSKTMQEISAGRNVENLLKVFARYEPSLGFPDKARLGLLRKMGKNRGWMMYYIQNPGAIVQKLLGRKA
jgi:hypothetical protein